MASIEAKHVMSQKMEVTRITTTSVNVCHVLQSERFDWKPKNI